MISPTTRTLPTLMPTDGFEDHREGDEQRVIQGSIVKFTNEGSWVTRDEEELPADQELIATGIIRVLQKWINKMPDPDATRILKPGENVDLEALNEAAPKSEWTEDPNGKRGPWQCQYLMYLLDPKTMDRYTFATGTVGGGIAVRDLRDKVTWMRRMRGQNIFAVVTLADKFMKTKFSGRQRPHFVVTRWIALGGDNANALPAPALREIESPSLAEDLGDEVPGMQRAIPCPPISAPGRLQRKRPASSPEDGGPRENGPSLSFCLRDNMPILYRDIETRSTLDLPEVGTARYAGDPSTDVWCVCFAIDDGPVQTWIPGQPIPEEFHTAARDPDWLIVAHNDAFERVIEELILAPRHGWPIIPIERHRCTMAMALASALPGKLEKGRRGSQLPIGKDDRGRAADETNGAAAQATRRRRSGRHLLA